jgi:membrane protease YdiL (CAAX protease family)
MPAAIIASSLLFGAVHLELAHALAATLLGLYLARVAVVGGGIRLAILCHVANNLTAVVLAAFASSDRYGSEAVRGTDALLALGSVIALAAALVQLTRNARAAAPADG